MKLNLSQIAILLFGLTFLASCGNDDDTAVETTDTFNLNITGLEDLGSTAIYEGWIMVDGSPKSTGTFSVDVNGTLSTTTFTAEKADIDVATAFILTVEPSPDADPAPSDVHILAGDFNNGTAELTVGHPAALNNTFSEVAGTYILATPTTTIDTDEESGLWFLDNSSGMPEAGLTLPTLPAGWAYEGWAVINGTPVSTGTFLSATGADDASIFSTGGPGFPGEDFIENAPAGLTFPTDLTGGVAVISIEPVPDNSPAPFVLKPLLGMIAEDAAVHTPLEMGQNLAFPTGQAVK